MIENLANLLKSIIDEEIKKLNEYKLSHAPTIGKMYEGLTEDILAKSIPLNLNLQIAHGVICNDLGEMTGEIDCMLVTGEGEKIPYTSSYKWHIKDVIAVIEVKKSLYKDDLFDSFEHLKGVQQNYTSHVQHTNELIDISSALKAFSQTTGIHVSSDEERNHLTIKEKIMCDLFITELDSPIKIVLGYHGYKSEYNFRKTFVNYLNKNLNTDGYGVDNFPDLIISGQYSLVKMNGQPYETIMQNDYWDFYTSARVNPALILLEILWTKLARNYHLDENWGNDLDHELFTPFLGAKIVSQNDNYGWEFKYIDPSNQYLKAQPQKSEWKPTYVTVNQFLIFDKLCRNETIHATDAKLLDFLRKENENITEFFNSLLKTGLIAIDKNQKLTLTTIECQCAILENGKFAVAENNTGLFTRWLVNR